MDFTVCVYPETFSQGEKKLQEKTWSTYMQAHVCGSNKDQRGRMDYLEFMALSSDCMCFYFLHIKNY